jgi:hypothetical protein
VLALHVGSLRPRGGEAALDVADVERVLALLRRCGRELLVWCPGIDLCRSLLAAGTDAVVVDEVPRVLAELDLLERAAQAPARRLTGRLRAPVTRADTATCRQEDESPWRRVAQLPVSRARTASMVSASAGVLSGRYRSTRANRSATPPG